MGPCGVRSVARQLLFIVPGFVFLGFAVVFYAGIGHDASRVPSALIGKPAPSFELPALVGDRPGLATADLRTKPVLVNIFASWCVPCRTEHPLLMRLAEQGVVLYGINFKDRPEEARAWLANFGDPYQRIGADRAGASTIDWGVYGVPETFLVDGTGMIRFKNVGPLTIGVINGTILPLLREHSK